MLWHLPITLCNYHRSIKTHWKIK